MYGEIISACTIQKKNNFNPSLVVNTIWCSSECMSTEILWDQEQFLKAQCFVGTSIALYSHCASALWFHGGVGVWLIWATSASKAFSCVVRTSASDRQETQARLYIGWWGAVVSDDTPATFILCQPTPKTPAIPESIVLQRRRVPNQRFGKPASPESMLGKFQPSCWAARQAQIQHQI